MSQEQEIIFMQVRLFKMAQEKWGIDFNRCSDLFRRYNIFEYISEAYELFHIQGDEANLTEIETYLGEKGVAV